ATGKRLASEPADAGRGVSAIAARADDDDDEARRGDCGRGCLPGADESRRRRRWSRRRGNRWRRARGGSASGAAGSDAAAFHDGESGLLSGIVGAERVPGIRVAGGDDALCPTFRGGGTARAGEGVPGCVGASSKASEYVMTSIQIWHN